MFVSQIIKCRVIVEQSVYYKGSVEGSMLTIEGFCSFRGSVEGFV